MNLRKFLPLMLVLMLISAPSTVVAKKAPTVKVTITPHAAGEPVQLFVTIFGHKSDYNLKIWYGTYKTWWAGGSDPYALTGGEVTWMECNYTPYTRNACEITWEGTLPKGKKVAHQFATTLTTTPHHGTWNGAIVVEGTIDGVHYHQEMTITQ